jgi:GH25 family lysozyme M1 (1,4-beta-N-acetylmuramidase)
MFTDIKIDSKEYPETNESIQILSRLAGDNNPDAPVPKGQSLYNLYENRSYKATVTGLGNAMIQPTQYFQLENIPLFNGAYLILTVEHNITANKMTTSFSGTKLLKYPMPRVQTPVAFTSYDDMSGGEAVRTALTVANQATMMTKERLEYLKSEMGIDVSHHNGNINWSQSKKDGVRFAFMKLTQGPSWYDGNHKNYNIVKNIKDAINNDIALSYYHFAHLGETSSPTNDGVTEANNFLNRMNSLITNNGIPKPKLPIVLDLEWDGFVDRIDEPRSIPPYPRRYAWNNNNGDINTFIKSFISTMNNNGYEVMIYSAKGFIDEYEINEFGQYPLWIARYFTLGEGKPNPETDEPDIPTTWKNGWTAWQFTSQGIVGGANGRVDINAMKSDFINKFA